uniref:DSBA-like thioredoxin domain-containing protein n=1 Tax=Ditylum brightwellii TaxID=49249 RepID=A0A6U3Z426_9STRA|mmetsp:Transcript_8630/g.12338  ORF Transcript_8630/g.12338 Transcript_8630/m.12338 type:complete len:161 (+) Transcript_8630:163-645(+)
MLRPNTPLDGLPKPPNTPSNPRVGAHMKSAGASVGIDFTGKCDRTPNTLLGHTLLEFALEKHGVVTQNELAEKIFKMYYTDGIFPDANNLSIVGQECGLEKSDIEDVLSDDERLETTQVAIHRNRNKVRSGVPFFVFNGQPAFSGAQDPSTFHQVFDQLL